MKLQLFSLLICIQVLAKDKPILEQGDINVTYNDIDGYALTIPQEKRSGFFHSSQRIGDSLYKILNMKHIVHYGKINNLIPDSEIQTKVNLKMMNQELRVKKPDNSDVIVNNDFDKLRKYYILLESYKYMQEYYKNKVKRSDLEELAEEEYLINKGKYFSKEKRNMDYLAVLYNINSKEEKRKKAENLIIEYEKSNMEMSEFAKKYKEDRDLVFTLGLNDFLFNEKFKDFSEYVFSSKKVGLIKPIFDANNRFLIVDIKKINESNYLPFEKAKNKIIERLAKKKLERDFNELLKSITMDEVKINQEAIVSLKTRYLDN